MLRAMTARQLAEWEAYARLDPFAEWRMDYRLAQVVQALVGGEKTLGELVLKFEAPDSKKPLTPEQRARQQIATAVYMAHQAALIEQQRKKGRK